MCTNLGTIFMFWFLSSVVTDKCCIMVRCTAQYLLFPRRRRSLHGGPAGVILHHRLVHNVKKQIVRQNWFEAGCVKCWFVVCKPGAGSWRLRLGRSCPSVAALPALLCCWFCLRCVAHLPTQSQPASAGETRRQRQRAAQYSERGEAGTACLL